jgi:hypothetical protein
MSCDRMNSIEGLFKQFEHKNNAKMSNGRVDSKSAKCELSNNLKVRLIFV